jgi:hypothetical protein
MAAPAVERWMGEDVSVAAIERELARLRGTSDQGPRLRTSVMTHLAWLPVEWVGAARATLAGLAERHPSRTILLEPEPDAGSDGIDTRLSLESFPLDNVARHVCSEVIELRLRGRRCQAPASVVTPLLIPDLPVFLRWRGRPPFAAGELEQLVEVADRLIVDSEEWPDVEDGFRSLAGYVDRVAVSDIAWGRLLSWRQTLAGLWPEIASVRRLDVAGPEPEALLLAGWLRSRLGVEVELRREPAPAVTQVALDGRPVEAPAEEELTASDLLSAELERFDRDRVYEQALAAAVTPAPARAV